MVARSIASVLIWMGYLIGLLLLGQSFDLGGGVIALAFVLALPVIAMTVTMWEHKSKEDEKSENSTSGDLEKRKRDRLDAILRELSDEQLAALKQRLSEPDFEDEVLYMLGDDGELVAPRQ